MSRFEQFREELARTKQEAAQAAQRDAAERAKKAEDDNTFWETSERSLLAAIKELSIEEYLNGIRDEVWQLGEVTVTPPERDLSHWETLKWAEVKAFYKLQARWPIFVEGGPADYDLDGYIPHLDDRVEETEASLKVWVSAHGDSVTVFVSSTFTSSRVKSEQFKYHGKEDIQKLEKMLANDCINRRALPYNQRKQKCEEEIVKSGLKSELIEYKRSRK